MSGQVFDATAVSGLFLGLLFGYTLEGAGFGSPRKLTAQFRLKDFAVFKVMFTAVLVAALGLWLSDLSGFRPSNSLYIPTVYFWAVALGGALIGAGFAMGGYCPGTSVVGLASGRLDALAFMAGMVAGIGLFAGAFEGLEDLYNAAKGPARQTLDQLTGLPVPVVLMLLIALAAAGFRAGSLLERRLSGPIQASDLGEDKDFSAERPQPVRHDPTRETGRAA